MKYDLTDDEIDLILTLLYEHKSEGSYYGNKKQHYKATSRLIKKLGGEEENENR